MSNWLPREKCAYVIDSLMRGESIRTISKNVGCAKGTVSHYRRLLVAAELCGFDDVRLPKCECGQQAGQRGWCAARFARSEARHKFISQWRR